MPSRKDSQSNERRETKQEEGAGLMTTEYRHIWNGAGYHCPFADKIVNETYTDPNRPGTFNACKLCGDPDFTVARDLRRLIEKRKQQAEVTAK